MLRFVIKRLLMIIPTLLVVSFAVFLLCNITPSDPGRIKLGIDAPQEAVDQINHELGYDRPLLERYALWVWNALHGDFGESYYTNRPVFEELLARFPYTLKLALLGLVSAIIAGIPLGVLCAVKQYSLADYSLSTLAMFLAAMPVFWISLLLLLQFSMNLGWFPSNGVTQGWKSWVLPTIPLTVGYGAGYLRYTRTAMLDTIRQDYIRTERSKGVPEFQVIGKYALKNSVLPVVTYVGPMVAALLTGTFIIEKLFSVPGLGRYFISAINDRDYSVTLGLTVFVGAMIIVCNLVVDILYAVIDPRVKITK